MQVVDDFHRSSYCHRREMFVVVKVAELRNGEAVESSRQPGQHYFHHSEDGMVRFKDYGVFAQGQSAGRGYPRGNLKKLPSSWNCQSKFVSSCAFAIPK